MSSVVKEAAIPDSRLARAITEYIRDNESGLLFNHSSRVYHFGALAGVRRGLTFDRELLYAGAMFHDLGLMPGHGSAGERFEVDGAHAARDFLRSQGIPEEDVYTVWTAIALHTTPGVPRHMHPVVALVTAGVEMDVLGIAYHDFTEEQRHEVCTCHPRGLKFKHGILSAFCYGTIKKPNTTFGNVKADVLERMDPTYKRVNFAEMIMDSAWDS